MELIPPLSEENKTHRPLHAGIEDAIESLRKRFCSKDISSDVTLKEVCCILEDLSNCSLGQHILLAGGSNGMWTDYMISPENYLLTNKITDLDLSVIERFFLFSSPAVLAQRELHKKLQKTAQACIGDGRIFASLPCGLMRDLLALDYSQGRNMSLVGIDIDIDSIEKSKLLAASMNTPSVNWIQKDAWNLEYKNAFDFISSIGLNMYESNKERVIQLYKNMFEALKPGGILFTGILTWPPYLNKEKSDWKVDLIPKFDMHLETLIHRDVLDIQWFNFRTLIEAKEDFEKAGFTHIRIEEDTRCIFPAVIATKLH